LDGQDTKACLPRFLTPFLVLVVSGAGLVFAFANCSLGENSDESFLRIIFWFRGFLGPSCTDEQKTNQRTAHEKKASIFIEALKEIPATTYSPTQLPGQYHRR
jgi:hypothetical protein